MIGRTALVPALLLLVVGTGCPEETYGIDGKMDKAIRQDMQERLEEHQRCKDGKLKTYSCLDSKDPKTCKWRCP
jgi:hypothetical protein